MQGIMVAGEYIILFISIVRIIFIIKLQNKTQNVVPDDLCPKPTAKTYIDLLEGRKPRTQ